VSIITEGELMAAIGRPRGFDRGAALEAAMHTFWRKGIRSPSLYATFGSKEALYLEAFDHYVRTMSDSLWDKLAQSTTARAGVESLLLAATEILPESELRPAGCMAMLGAVGDEWPPAVAEAVKKVRLDILNLLRSRLSSAAADGELPRSTDVDRLSRFYLSVVQGMAVQARDGATAAELKGAAEAALAAWPGGGVVTIR
jgi:AcrR family transcriptional regulator